MKNFWPILLVSIFLIVQLFLVFVLQLPKKFTQVVFHGFVSEQDCPVITTPSVIPTPTPQYPTSGTVLNYQQKMKAHFLAYADGRYAVSVESLRKPISPDSEPNWSYIPNPNTIIYEGKINYNWSYFLKENYQLNHLNVGLEFPVTFASNKSELAIFVPHKLLIYSLEIKSDNQVLATKQREVELPPMKQSKEIKVRMFYTGDDESIYISRDSFYGETSVLLYSLSQEQFTQINSDFAAKSFPLNNSAKIAYFDDLDKLKVWHQGQVSSYKIPERADYDYSGIFSPTNNYVCLNRGSSGAYWYEVYAFPSMKLLYKDLSVSSCINWTGSRWIVVERHQGPYALVFELDVVSGTKRLIKKEYPIYFSSFD